MLARLLRYFWWICLCFLTLVSVAQAATNESQVTKKMADGGFSYRTEPKPQWISSVSGANGGEKSSAMRYELIDEQINVEQQTYTYFAHIVRVIDTPAGLENGTHIETVFDPTYQSLALHSIEVIRDGKRINKLASAKIQLLQRETQLESLMYNGLVTATIELTDIRAGDKIEYAYSIKGANPVFQGKFVYSDIAASTLGSTDFYQLRLLIPENRNLQIKAGDALQVTKKNLGRQQEVLVQAKKLPQFNYDVNAPMEAYLDNQVDISEFSDWSSVANWGANLFKYVVTPEVKAKADAIRQSASTPEARLQATLDFVQGEVRYLGMEIGPNTHQPNTPQVVMKQRFGDCKDKVFLLTTLLRELGIEAKPVFVSTRYMGAVERLLPSPLDFNHVIAKVELEGKTYWLDGTRAYQKGGLDERQSVGYVRGLPADAGATSLVKMPGIVGEERVAVKERIKMDRMSDDPLMESHITYSGELAESLRSSIANMPKEKIEDQFMSEYIKYYPKIRRNGVMKVEEVPGHNALTIVQEFTLPDFWSYPEERNLYTEVVYWNNAIAIVHPNESSRKLAFLIPLAGVYRHEIVFDFPEDVMRSQESNNFKEDNAIFSYQVDYKATPRLGTLTAILKFYKDTVTPAEWPTYTQKTLDLRPGLASSVSVSAISKTKLDKLDVDLRTLQQSINNGKDLNMTRVQMDSKVQSLVLNAQLESGRLNPKLKAKALKKLGIQQDHLGLKKQASTNFNEAIRLAPDDASIYAEAATNAFSIGDDSLAKQYANKALALSPNDTAVYNTLAFTNYYSKDYAGAKQSLLEVLKKMDGGYQDYAAIWLYLTALRSGEDAKSAVAPYVSANNNEKWPNPVLQALVGNAKYEDALRVAREDGKDLSKLCELYFYMGEKSLIEGDKAHAREFFEKSINTRVVEFNEYNMSKRSLEAIGH